MPAQRNIEILDLINAIAHQATAGMQRTLRQDEAGLVAMEARTLRYVARHPGCTQSDIVRESQRDKAQIARIIKVLLDRGEVRRLPDEDGHKRHRLEVTASGAAMHERAEALRASVAGSLFAPLGADEQAQLLALLAKAAAHDAQG